MNIATRTTGQALVDGLIDDGIDTVYGIPGVHTYEFSDALAQSADRIRFIHTRHEQAAGYMAYGHARSTGRPGVFTVVPGPGLLNASAALCTAYAGHAPVLCVTSNIMTHLMGRGRGQLHELPDQLATASGIVKWAGRINDPGETPSRLGEAFQAMRSGRRGPAVIEAPWDVFARKGPVIPVEAPPAFTPMFDPDAVISAAAMIAGAKRPMIFVGHGAVDAGGEILDLARRIGAPVVAHRSGKGIVPDDSPYAFNLVAGYDWFRDCDLMIGVGSRLELPHMRWRWLPPGLKTIRIDIDPLEAVRIKPDLFVLGDASDVLRALRPLVARTAPAGMEEQLQACKDKARLAIAGVEPQVSYLAAIREVLPRDGFLVEEISQIGFTARFAFPVYHPRGYITSAYQENLGFGFNTALGVKAANPDKAVVSVAGDGGFLFGVQELATAVQYDFAVTVIVFDNGAFGNVLRDQDTAYHGRRIGAELRNPDFVALGQSFGVESEAVETPADLRAALSRALESDRPRLIVVKQARGSDASPWTFLHPAPHG
jgi:acetolactate synthase-1/2/3 large subunit